MYSQIKRKIIRHLILWTALCLVLFVSLGASNFLSAFSTGVACSLVNLLILSSNVSGKLKPGGVFIGKSFLIRYPAMGLLFFLAIKAGSNPVWLFCGLIVGLMACIAIILKISAGLLKENKENVRSPGEYRI